MDTPFDKLRAGMLDNDEFADKIPYPKEHPSLPKILSREELALLFASCNNDKHRAMFRLIYSSGLRRSELRHLKIHGTERFSIVNRNECPKWTFK